MAIRIGSRDELKIVSDEIIRLMEDGYRVFLLTGDLGAGKTTLVQHICQQLETEESVSSPTFSLVNAYSSRSMGVIYHMDFYRLNKTDDLVQIGLEEYLDSGNLCFIEWPEIATEHFFPPYVHVAIEVDQNNIRIFNIKKYDAVDA